MENLLKALEAFLAVFLAESRQGNLNIQSSQWHKITFLLTELTNQIRESERMTQRTKQKRTGVSGNGSTSRTQARARIDILLYHLSRFEPTDS